MQSPGVTLPKAVSRMSSNKNLLPLCWARGRERVCAVTDVKFVNGSVNGEIFSQFI